MKRNNIKSAKGFTLVEMLGVLAIIAILISVISVGVLSAINRARVVGTAANFKTYETALTAYLAMPQSAALIPATEGTGTIPSAAAFPGGAGGTAWTPATAIACTLDQVLLAAGVLDRYPTWRVGNDPVINGTEPRWSMKQQGFMNSDGSDDNNTVGTTSNAPTVTNLDLKTRAEALPTRVGVVTDVAPDGYTAATPNITFQVDGINFLPTNAMCAYIVIPQVNVSDALKLSEEINGKLNTATPAAPTQLAGRFVFRAPAAGITRVTCFYYLTHL